jgi:hypothetical protein
MDDYTRYLVPSSMEYGLPGYTLDRVFPRPSGRGTLLMVSRPALVLDIVMLGALHPLRKSRSRLRFDWLEPLELHRVRVVALCADPPPLLPPLGPVAYPLAVYAGPPVAVDLAVTLAAEPHGLIEAYLLTPKGKE